MSDKFDDLFDPDEALSFDELLAETKQQLDEEQPAFSDLPAEDGFAAPAEDEFTAPAEEASFTPDFGDAFDDYGEYENEAPLTPLGDYQTDEYEEDGEEAPPPEKPKRKAKRRIVPLFVKVILYLVIVGITAIGLGYGIWECAQDVLAFGRSDEMLTVTIKESDTLDDIAQMLADKGVIKYPWLFKFYCNFTDSGDTMDPGTYEIYYNYDYHALVNGMIASSPNRTTVRVMIPEGMTAAQIFALMEKNGVCTVDELAKCAAETEFDYWFLEGIPYGEENRLEGFLFPDTYDFYEDDDPERVLDKLLTNFDRKFSDNAKEQLVTLNEAFAERLSAAGYDEDYIAAHQFSVYELITVASMIERETAGVTESGNIASVIYNRLCDPANWPYINIDATVVYALGGINRPLTYEDTQVDSPYNTYKHAGLPVGPISNPGLSSITAALNPADTDYYFYALDKSTGFHHFSKTYDEHNAFLQEQENAE